MKSIKRAWINLIRMPIRNLLYLIVVFSMISVTIVCGRLYMEGRTAHEALKKEYPIVATVNSSIEEFPGNGSSTAFIGYVTLDDVMILQQSDAVYAINARVQTKGTLAEPEVISRLPGDHLAGSEPPLLLVDDSSKIVAVTNLLMEQTFFDGTYQMMDGRTFDSEDIKQCKNSAVISKHTAEKYGLKVGDTLVVRLYYAMRYSAMQIIGIYEDNSGEIVSTVYIPYTYLMSDLASYDQGEAMIDKDAPYRFDQCNRFDFMLRSAEDVNSFMQYVYEHDKGYLTVTVNDKDYKIADMGLTQIETITLFLLIAAFVAGIVIIVCITAYCRSTRVREAHILRCLGMKKGHIRAMFAIEMVIVFGFGTLFGAVSGMLVANTAIGRISEGYIAEMQAELNHVAKATESSSLGSNAVLSYPLYIRFGETAKDVPDAKEGIIPSKAYLPEDAIGVRYEVFYAGDQESFGDQQITVTGRTDISADGSVGIEQLYDETRAGGMIVPCVVGRETGYAVGDLIRVSRQKFGETVSYEGKPGETAFRYIDCPPAYAYLKVTEVAEGSDITVAMSDLEWLCTYLSFGSEIYRSIRYDECIVKED